MKENIISMAGVLFVIMIGLGLSSGYRSSAIKTPSNHPLVVLELFTSQGCSSCPPAEAVLAKLASSKKYERVILPLAFHVDYWNHLGWVDPYSSPEWTNRQSAYREVFGGATLYTPQLIVQGQHEMVGADESKIKRHVEKIRKDQALKLYNLNIQRASHMRNGLTIEIHVSPEDTVVNTPVILVTTIFENARPTEVSIGENAGRTLRNKYVVRFLERQMLNVELGEEKVYQSQVVPDPDWEISNMGVAVWVQELNTLKILEADVSERIMAKE